MQTYHLKTITDSSGKLTVTGLPPSEEFTILILPSAQHNWQERMKQWMNELREEHPYSGMGKDEILRQLKESRKQTWKAEYAH